MFPAEQVTLDIDALGRPRPLPKRPPSSQVKGIVPLVESLLPGTQAADLPAPHHVDPQDRLIIATAPAHQTQLVSADGKFPLYAELAGGARILIALASKWSAKNVTATKRNGQGQAGGV